jgi:hypothetical protein
MKRKLVFVSIATLTAFVFVAAGFIGTISFPANAQQSDQVKVEITGKLVIPVAGFPEGIKYTRFVDTETKVVCYVQGNSGSISCVKQSIF